MPQCFGSFRGAHTLTVAVPFGGGQILILSGINLYGEPEQVFASVGSVHLQILIQKSEDRAFARRAIGFTHR